MGIMELRARLGMGGLRWCRWRISGVFSVNRYFIILCGFIMGCPIEYAIHVIQSIHNTFLNA